MYFLVFCFFLHVHSTQWEGNAEFKNIHSADITDEVREQGRIQLILHGAGSIKKMKTLTYENFFTKVEMWLRHKAGCDARIGIITLVRDMIRSGLFFPSAQWVIPSKGQGMDVVRSAAVLEMLRAHENTTHQQIKDVFFNTNGGYTRPGLVYPGFGCELPSENYVDADAERDEATFEAKREAPSGGPPPSNGDSESEADVGDIPAESDVPSAFKSEPEDAEEEAQDGLSRINNILAAASLMGMRGADAHRSAPTRDTPLERGEEFVSLIDDLPPRAGTQAQWPEHSRQL